MSSGGLQLVCATCKAFWKEKALDQLTLSGRLTAAEPSMREQYRYAYKAEAATQIHEWHIVSAPSA